MSTTRMSNNAFFPCFLVLAAALVAVTAPLASAAVVAHYKFDGDFTDETTSHDASANTGTVTFTTDRNGNPSSAGVFDGGSSLTTNSDSNGLSMGGNFTALAWTFSDSLSGDRAVFGKDAGGNNNQLHLTTRANKNHLGFFADDEGGDQSLATGTWTHLGWQYSTTGGTQSIWVNGSRDVAGSGHSALGNGGGNVLLGRWGGGNQFDGNLDELIIFDEVLSPNQIQHVMNGGDPNALPAASNAGGNVLARINPLNGHYYDLVRGDVTWDEARVLSGDTSVGGAQGHLATISSSTENSFVRALEGKFDKWIGFHDSDAISTIDGANLGATEGTFQWVNGEPVVFTNWNGGEPNNSGGEDAAHITGGGGWNDHNSGSSLGQSDHRLGYVVEYDYLVDTANQGTFSVRAVNKGSGFGTIQEVEDFLNANPGGAKGNYFAIDLVDPDDFSTSQFEGGAPFPNDVVGVVEDNFAVEATGRITIEFDDTYTFGVDRDDLFRLYIDGVNIAEGACCGETLAQQFLTAGIHDVRLLFAENGGGADVELYAARGAFNSFDPLAFQLVGDVLNGGLLVTPVPEAGTASLVLLGVGLIAVRRRRRS